MYIATKARANFLVLESTNVVSVSQPIRMRIGIKNIENVAKKYQCIVEIENIENILASEYIATYEIYTK